MQPKQNKKAFTLVELLMVLSIIALMMVLFKPSIEPIENETKQMSVTKNKDTLTSLVSMKLDRIRAKNIGGDELLDILMEDLNAEPTLANMTNPLDDTKKGIGLIKGATYDDTNKAAYLFTSEPKIITLPEGTVYTVIKPEQLVAEGLPNVELAPDGTIKEPNLLTFNINSTSHSTIIHKNNNTYVLGQNTYSQLGIGTMTDQLSPTILKLADTTPTKTIIIGISHSLAIGTDGNLYSWGRNYYGQLGIGDTTDRTTPTLINLPNNIKPTQIAVASNCSLAIGTDGNLYAWGYNGGGQLGDATIPLSEKKTSPIKVPLVNSITPKYIYAGLDHILLIDTNGNLYSWGSNSDGQLGLGNTTRQTTPQKVTFPSNVKPTQISTGREHVLALCSDGNLYSWGYNGYGQLGLGNTTNQTTPQLVTTFPEGVKPIQIAVGGRHSIVLCSDGNLYSWGYNGFGQLGDGTTTNQSTPQLVTLPFNLKPKTVHAGAQHTIVTTTDNNIYVFGLNAFYQLGIENTENILTPALMKKFDDLE